MCAVSVREVNHQRVVAYAPPRPNLTPYSRAAAIKSERLTFGACGPSVWRTAVWLICAAHDWLTTNSVAAMAAMAAQTMMTRILTRYRAEGFVFTAPVWSSIDRGR